MNELEVTRRRRTISPLRAFAWAFVLGFGITVPATFFALLVPVGETVFPYLAPGPVLLRPFLADLVADWPGLVNVALASAANGLAYGAIALVTATLVNRARR